MKTLKILCGCACALLALACTKTPDEPEVVYDEAYYASVATVSSDDTGFTAADNGGTIRFKAEGGEVVLKVDCGTEWTILNQSSDLFDASYGSSSVTVFAGKNLLEEEITGTIVLMTATARIEFAQISIVQNAYGAPEITVETNEWHAPAAGALSTSIGVESSIGTWEVESTADWLSVESVDSGVVLTAEANDDTVERSARVTLTAGDGYKSDSQTITVTQDARVYLNVGREKVRFYSDDAGSTDVTVESNYDWDFSYDTSNGWYSVSSGDGYLRVTITSSDSEEDRDGVITITAGDGAENVVSSTLAVSLLGLQPEAFILQFSITSDNTVLTLPLRDEVDCTVDWGDGSDIETFTESYPAHTYASADSYTVRINGKVTDLNFKEAGSDSATLLTEVRQWGDLGLTNLESAFNGCSALTALPEGVVPPFDDVTTCYLMFNSCAALTEIPAGIFDKCSKTENFENVFYGCKGLETLPSGLFDNCTEATSFKMAFYQCTGLLSIPDGLFDNCSKVTSFDRTFTLCSSLAALPDGLFAKCHENTTFYQTFYGCSALSTIPSDLFAGCSKVTTFYCTFYQCSGLTSLPEGLLDDCTGVTDMSWTFRGCTGLESVPGSLFTNCTNVTTMSYVFYGCSALVTVPEELFSKNTEVTTFSYAFNTCSALESIPKGLFANNTKVTDFSRVFFYCNALTSVPAELFANCPLVTTFNYAFHWCKSLTELPDGLFDGNPEVTNFAFAFNGCDNLKTVPVHLFSNCKKVNMFSSTFNGCALEGESPYDEIEVNGSTAKVHLYERFTDDYKDYYGITSMTKTSCFTGCTGLTDWDAIVEAGWN